MKLSELRKLRAGFVLPAKLHRNSHDLSFSRTAVIPMALFRDGELSGGWDTPIRHLALVVSMNDQFAFVDLTLNDARRLYLRDVRDVAKVMAAVSASADRYMARNWPGRANSPLQEACRRVTAHCRAWGGAWTSPTCGLTASDELGKHAWNHVKSKSNIYSAVETLLSPLYNEIRGDK